MPGLRAARFDGQAVEASAKTGGADGENRTRIFWVEASGSAFELHPQQKTKSDVGNERAKLSALGRPSTVVRMFGAGCVRRVPIGPRLRHQRPNQDETRGCDACQAEERN